MHEIARGRVATVDVDGTDHRLERIGEDRVLVASATGCLAVAEHDERTETDLAGAVGKGVRVDDGLTEIAQAALGVVGKSVEGDVSDHPTEHGVTEELEPFVRMRLAELGLVRAVQQGEAQV